MNDQRNDFIKPLSYFSIENYIPIAIIFMITLLITLNILRIYQDARTANQFEPKKNYDIENTSYNSTMTFSIEGNQKYPMVEIMINGEVIDKFGENNEITINIREGNVVQINGSMYRNDIMVHIKHTSITTADNLNTDILVQQNISTLAVIKM